MSQMSQENLLQVFLKSVSRLRHRPCLRFKQGGAWRTISWIEACDQVQEIALGLQSIGIRKDDRVAIFSASRYEWTLCDLAILSLGAVSVPIYPSVTADQAAYILKDSDARVVFVEDQVQFRKIRSVRKRLPKLKQVILISGGAEKGTMSLAQLRQTGQAGDEEAWKKGIEKIKPVQMATIVYTSGTTGPPKGAVLTHGNFVAEIEALVGASGLSDRHVGLLFLPLAHIFARAVQFLQLGIGFVQVYSQGIESVVSDIQEIQPHFFASVPRIFEKIHEQVQARLETAPRWKKRLLATVAGRFLVSHKIRSLFGRRLRFAISGGAPLSRELAEYFHRAGVLILEGYGLTETTAGIFLNSEKEFRFGTVGKSLLGVEKRIAPDGEILIRAPMIFQGYYKNPRATAAVLSRDGWFHTGDIGEIDRDGFLKITDRKKDIIVTSAGKNIAPQNIENLMKAVPYISHLMVYGDRRKYLTALVTLNRPAVEEYLRRQKVRANGRKDLSQHPEVYRLIREAIEEKNQTLPSYETIKRFAILENEFTQEAGEITPTLKLKRKFVSEKYRDVIDELYQS